MNKNIIKMALITTIMFFGMFFTNIDSAKADCTCYYYADLIRDRGTEKEGDRQTTHRTFLFGINYGDNHANVVYSCYADDFGWKNLNPDNLKKACGASDNVIKRGNPFNVNSSYISNKQCSESACNSANLKLWCGTDIVTDGYAWNGLCNEGVLDVKYITADQAKKIQDGDDAFESATKAGVSSGTANIDDIIDWGDNPSDKYEDADNIDCQALMNDYEEGQTIIDFLNNLFWTISIIGIVLLLIMTAIEFIKVITGQDDAGLKKAFKHTVIRAICVIILLLLPVIITTILDIINKNSSDVQIGANGQVMCGIGE